VSFSWKTTCDSRSRAHFSLFVALPIPRARLECLHWKGHLTAYFVAFETKLTPTQLAAKRRRLAGLLRKKGIELHTLMRGQGKSIVQRLASEARGAAVIVLDDEHPTPDKSPWIAELVKQAADLTPQRRPQLIYITRQTTAAGISQVLDHAIIKYYVKGDSKGVWVKTAAMLAGEIARQTQVDPEKTSSPTSAEDDGEIVGNSTCFREAVDELARIIRPPYGMVSGEAGVGKMFLIQSLWRQFKPDAPLIVLPCGSFFKDYYIGETRRRFGGGREAVDQLVPYLEEANEGLLVLHHVERLPTALQEELVARLLLRSRKGMKNPVVGVDRQALVEHDVRVLATSAHSPQDLRNRGLIEELAVKLAKRHVRIPSLAQRGVGDVDLICHDILRRIVHRQTGGDDGDWVKLVPQFDPAALQLLRHAQCPSNISDLLRWIEYAWRHCRGGTIRRHHLPPDIAIVRRKPAGTLDEIVADAQRTAIRNALDQTGGDIPEAAAILGRTKGALYRLMGTLGMTEGERDE